MWATSPRGDSCFGWIKLQKLTIALSINNSWLICNLPSQKKTPFNYQYQHRSEMSLCLVCCNYMFFFYFYATLTLLARMKKKQKLTYISFLLETFFKPFKMAARILQDSCTFLPFSCFVLFLRVTLFADWPRRWINNDNEFKIINRPVCEAIIRSSGCGCATETRS